MTAAAMDRVARGSVVGPLASLAQWMMLTSGWRRIAVAFGAGALGALAMPPFGLFPALVVSLGVAVWLIDGAATGRYARRGAVFASALIGWAWGFGYLTAGLWWLGSAFLVEAEEFLWALPLGVLGLPAVLALFYAAGFALARLLWTRGAARLVALAVGLAACEWLRGHLFTGFPWNTLGMALGQNLWLMQGASVVGLYGLTLLAVAGAGAAPPGSRPRPRPWRCPKRKRGATHPRPSRPWPSWPWRPSARRACRRRRRPMWRACACASSSRT
jgi:apolipoprotein N-acyltransferase